MIEDDSPELKQLRTQLVADANQRPRQAFLDYCLGVVALVDSGAIDRPRAAYSITWTLFVGRLDDDPQLEEIMHLAGQLEIMPRIGATNPQWRRLTGLVAELAADEHAEGAAA